MMSRATCRSTGLTLCSDASTRLNFLILCVVNSDRVGTPAIQPPGGCLLNFPYSFAIPSPLWKMLWKCPEIAPQSGIEARRCFCLAWSTGNGY